jgi:hypothetical protein
MRKSVVQTARQVLQHSEIKEITYNGPDMYRKKKCYRILVGKLLGMCQLGQS